MKSLHFAIVHQRVVVDQRKHAGKHLIILRLHDVKQIHTVGRMVVALMAAMNAPRRHRVIRLMHPSKIRWEDPKHFASDEGRRGMIITT